MILLSLFYLFVLNSVFLKINQAFISQTLYFSELPAFVTRKTLSEKLWLVPILTSFSLSHFLYVCFPYPCLPFLPHFLFPLPFGLLVRQPLLPCSLPSLQNKMVKGSLSTEQSERGWGGKCTPGNGNKSKHRWVGESFQFPPAVFCGSLPPAPSPFQWETKVLLCTFRKFVITFFFFPCYRSFQASDHFFVFLQQFLLFSTERQSLLAFTTAWLLS